ncbi:MAG: crosslink repair DNA glycosylase YcaQ family protein, partial [Paludibacter sp.]
MTLNEISNCRIVNQKIVGTAFKTAKELVGWMGAMQAQDYSMAKLAIGIRVLNSTEEKIESAFNNAEILRTHVLRPTWHFVPAEDIYWMLDLTVRRIKSSMTS